MPPILVELLHDETRVAAAARVALREDGDAGACELSDWGLAPAGSRDDNVPGLGDCAVTMEEAGSDGLRLVRETLRPKDGRPFVAVRLLLRNAGTSVRHVESLTPVYVEGDGLRLGGAQVSDWMLLREPRKKNDMPACIRLGSDSPAIWDAVRGTMETGGWARQEGGALPHRFVSSELTVLRAGRSSVLFGLLPLDLQLVQSVLELTPDRSELVSLRVDCQCDGQELAPGEELVSQWVLVHAGEDPFASTDVYAEALRVAHAKAGPEQDDDRRPPTVWCSWYYYGDGFTQEECEENLAALAERPLPIDVVQIDECWDLRWGDWTPNADWPDLKGTVDRIKAAGLRPGIWTCPVLVESRSRTRYAHPEWLLRDRKGEPIRFPMNNMQNLVLDTTNPEAVAFIEGLYRWLREETGFTYFKLDFMRAVGDPDAVFQDRSKNRAQAYRAALQAVCDGAGEGAYINVCGGFYGPSLGLADAQRTGSDVKSIWPAAPRGEEGHGYGPFTIKQNTLRYWMNRLWDNDPDALMVRRRPEAYRDERLSLGLMNDNEALTSTLNQYLSGGLVCFTENLAEIEDDRLLLLRHCAPSIGQAAIPRDAFSRERFPAVFDTRVVPSAEGLAEWHTVSLVNWFEEERTFSLTLDRELLGEWADGRESFTVSAFRAGWTRSVRAGGEVEVGPIAPHACEVVKVQARRDDGPMVLRTTGHFSMGGTEIVGWRPSAEGVSLGVSWPWQAPLEIEVAPARGKAFEGAENDAPVTLTVDGDRERVQTFGLRYR